MKRATKAGTVSDSIRTISIHALVKRATLDIAGEDYKVDISIHALVKRATPYSPV